MSYESLAPAKQIYIAFDYEHTGVPEAQAVFEQLQDTGAGAKLGLEITALTGWPRPLGEAQDSGFDTFADAKLKDIGNTMVKTGRAILRSMPKFLNAHADASFEGLKALVKTRDDGQADVARSERTQLLGVTVLTDKEDPEAFADYRRGRKKQVLHYADKLLDAGFDGVVCSPQELDVLAKYSRFDRLVRMVPAIRPAWSVPNDQKNFTTPTEAIQRGATYIVVGRPITEQYKMTGDAQLAAFRAVEQEVKEAL